MQARDIVLIVDDSPGTLGMLTEVLEQAGFTVLIAADGPAAITLVQRVTPDIVLMDAIIPEMDGFEICRRIKRVRGMEAVPVIFMTGLSETEHVIRGLEAGGVDYVTKPVAPDEIIARIRVHLANARLTRSAQVALDAAGRFLLAADRGGGVLWCTPQAARLLGAEQTLLAPELRLWRARLAEDAEGRAPERSMTLAAPGGRQIEVSFIGRIGPGEFLLRLVEADPQADAMILRQRLGVTAREAEVLLWIARGKANRDIAEILGLSPRTVNKHLEQIFAKLGVENRASAAALALRTLGGG